MTHEEIAEAIGWHVGFIRDTNPESLISRISALVANAEAAQRERCAKIVEEYNPGGSYHIRTELSKEIRRIDVEGKQR